MGKIKVLPDKVAIRIAAGEIVERPASVVKELLENSLDAGSSSIKVEIEKGGKTLICVSDNGYGISPEDVKFIGERHATSKIIFFEDIQNISTLGFRGEALASISSVSQFRLTSAAQGENEGTELSIQGGGGKSLKNIGFPRGTTVEVKNLFFNVPARKKFLKTDTTELSHIHKIFTREVLVHPEISFSLWQNKKEIIKTVKSPDYLQRISRVLGKDLAGELLPLRFQSPKVNISGFIAKPGYSRLDRDYQLFYVNKRWISSRFLAHAVTAAYHSFLEPRRIPAVIIFLEVAPEEADINIHPSKREVRFRNERLIHDILFEVIRKTLKESEPHPAFIAREEKGEGNGREFLPAGGFYEEKKEEDRKEGIKEAIGEYLIKEEIGASLLTPEIFAEGTCLQIRRSYIIYHDKEGLYIIDQHAAHERVLFDRLNDEKKVPVQSLLIPVKMEVSAEEAVLFKKFSGVLEKLGFEIEHFGGQSFIIRTIPAIFKRVDPKPLVYDLLDEFRNAASPASFPEEKIYQLIACHSAVRWGDKLTPKEMTVLIKDWKRSKQPFNCPHGRPTAIKLTWNELEKKFKRH